MGWKYYLWSLTGIYFYVLFQVAFLYRFGEWNDKGSAESHTFVVLVGVLSVAWYLFLRSALKNKHATKRQFSILLLSYSIAIPFAYFGTLFGGLLGMVGIAIGGLVPFIFLTSCTYFMLIVMIHKKQQVE
jgi:preprotein translocase subunit YajC